MIFNFRDLSPASSALLFLDDLHKDSTCFLGSIAASSAQHLVLRCCRAEATQHPEQKPKPTHPCIQLCRQHLQSLDCLLQGEGAAGTVEAVIIPVHRPSSSRPRTTLCISSQVGCAQNCQFCFTGRMGLQGNLSTAQIVEQVPRLPLLRMQSPGCLRLQWQSHIHLRQP